MTDAAFHFTAATLRDGSPIPPVGAWLEHAGPLVLCESGLHASKRVLDALDAADREDWAAAGAAAWAASAAGAARSAWDALEARGRVLFGVAS